MQLLNGKEATEREFPLGVPIRIIQGASFKRSSPILSLPTCAPGVGPGCTYFKKVPRGTFLTVQRLRLHLSCRGYGFVPCRGAKILHASGPKKTEHCNKFNTDFKNGPHLKKRKLQTRNQNDCATEQASFPYLSCFCLEEEVMPFLIL